MRIHRHSMQRTLFITYLALTLVVAIVLAQGSYWIYSRILMEKTIQEKQKNVNLAADQISTIMKHVESFSRLAVLNENLQTLAGSQLTAAEMHDLGYTLKDDLNYMQQNSGEIEDIVAHFFDGRLYHTSNVDGAVYRLIGESPVRFPYVNLEYKNQVKVVNTRKIKYLRHEQPTNVISVYRPIISYTTTDIMGILQFDIKETKISEIFATASVSDNAKFYMTDENGFIISSTDESLIYTKMIPKETIIETNVLTRFFPVYDETACVNLSQELPQYGWNIIAVFPVEEIIGENRNALGWIWGIAGICSVMALIPIVFLSNGISRPLKKLSNTMEKVGAGDLHIRADDSRKDEIGRVSGVFNTMMTRIENLIHQNEQEQQEKRKFEFMAMQQQIQPHFLYNTLDNICALITLGYEKEAFRLTKTLGQFYRASLSGGHMLIPLDRELDIANKYLTIQKVRFKDSFCYSIEASENCADVLVPKLIIQPIVENALVHGIRDCNYMGQIDIRCHLEGNYLYISVSDNGKGFSPEALTAFEGSNSAEEQPNRSFGVQSIINRLKFYYDPACRMTIRNLESGGSEVTIVLKKEVGSGEQSDYRR